MKMCGITEIMEIRKATERDIDEIVEVFNDAKKSMKKAGINQWDDSYDGYPSAEEAQIDIANGSAYVLCDAEHVIGYTAIVFADDVNYERIDGRWLNAAPYGVLHRTSLLSSYKGQGLAGLFFDYAEDLARQKGIRNLRIDTHEDNVPMLHCIARHSYVYCGVVYMVSGDGTPRNAYQKIL